MRPDADPLISVAEAARHLSLNKSTLSRQIRTGAIRSHDGKVRLSEVLADRANNIDLTRSARGEGSIDALDATAPVDVADDTGFSGALHQPADATLDATISPSDATLAEADATDAEPEDGVMVDGAVLPYATARAMKETYIAKLRRLEFDTKRAELAPVAEMVAFNERIFGVIRERLLAIPGKLSGDLDAEQVERVTLELHEALEELSDPRDGIPDLEPVEDEDEEDDGGAAPAAPPQPRGVGRAVPVRGAEDERRPR